VWQIKRTDRLARRLKKYQKSNLKEVEAAFDNLDTYLVSLNEGVKPMQMFQHRFVHNERKGVQAIDPSPLKKGFKALRLYVYPDEATCTLYVITLGGKEEQAADVQQCAEFVQDISGISPKPHDKPEEKPPNENAIDE